MRKIILLMVLYFCGISVFASSTEASRFAEEQYAKITGNEKVRINVKKEHTMEYQQKIGNQIIPAITYGYGDMKAVKRGKIAGTNKRKLRISYICLLDENCNPMWSYIVPSK